MSLDAVPLADADIERWHAKAMAGHGPDRARAANLRQLALGDGTLRQLARELISEDLTQDP